MTHSKTGLFISWHDTQWKQLSDEHAVYVPEDDELAIVSVHFVDKDERPRDFPLALNGRVISHVEINGARYLLAPEYVDDCEVLD